MNTLLLLIIIGTISAILGKGKKQTSKQNRFPLKSLRKISEVFTAENESMLPQRGQKNPLKHSNKSVNRSIKHKPAENSLETITIIEAVKPEREVRKLLIPEVKENPVVASERLEADSIIKGIIWSEILGEPRAKRLYHPKRK